MDRFGHLVPSLDELKQIQSEVRACNSLGRLRGYFDRVQELRRIHSGNFDVQLAVAEAQETIVERARDLRSRGFDESEAFEEPSLEAERRSGFEARHEYPHAGFASNGAPPPEGVEYPPAEAGIPQSKSWRRATLLALVFTAGICVVFFYLIQTARRINLPQPVQTAAPKQDTAKQTPAAAPPAGAGAVPASGPAVRLYTDLIPGTVSIDDGEPQDLKDGELILDHLEPGRHSLKIAGRGDSAAFSFDVSAAGAPQAITPLTATDALAVAVSAQDGKGHLLTSAQQPEVSLDGKSLGEAGADGLELTDLSTSDHELQVNQGGDKQRFVLTYTAAPALTFYVKSIFNGGVVTLKSNQDGASVFIDDKPYRRKTDHGQLRMPLKAGTYTIRVHKDGFADPAPQTVTVTKGDEPQLAFDLQATPALAYLDVRNASPRAAVFVDGQPVATVDGEGNAVGTKVKPGEHTIELRQEGAQPKKFARSFAAGDTVTLAGAETTLQKLPPAEPVAAAVPAASTAKTASAPAATGLDLPAEQVRRGGGFVHYSAPRTSGRYSFQAHAKIGGVFKHDKLQWYAGYENSENYVLFSVDGKHASIREMSSGRAREINRIPFNANSDGWVQVDMSVRPGAIATRIKTPGGGWTDLGTVDSDGRDFTQDQVGFYLPGNDEVAVANFHFSPHGGTQ